jgi:phage tail sheath gpL-like
MSINFSQIQFALRPGVAVEIERAITKGLYGRPAKALIVAQKLAASGLFGTATADVPVETSLGQEDMLFGRGSHAAQMVKLFFKINPFGRLAVAPVADDAAGVAATGTVSITGAPTAVGSQVIGVGNSRYATAVAISDTPTIIAANLAAAITADVHAAFTAAAAAGVLTITAKNKGTLGNSVQLVANPMTGDASPLGVTVTTANMTGGATNPSIATLLANIANGNYWFVGSPLIDASNMALWVQDTTARWQANNAKDYILYTARRDTYAGQLSYLGGRNHPFECIKMVEPTAPDADWLHCAARLGRVSFAVPLGPTMPVHLERGYENCITATPEQGRYTDAQRESLLQEGGSTSVVDPNGRVLIEYLLNTNTQNAFGSVDREFNACETINTLSWLRYDYTAYWQSNYIAPGSLLVEDADLKYIDAGLRVMSPMLGNQAADTRYNQWQGLGLVQDYASYKAGRFSEIDELNKDQLNQLLPINLVNQLRRVAVRMEYSR